MDVKEYITKNISRKFEWGVWDSFQFVIKFLKENREDPNIALELDPFFLIFNKSYNDQEGYMSRLRREGFNSLEEILGEYFDKDPMMTTMQQRAYYNDGDIAIVYVPLNPNENFQPKENISAFHRVSYYYDPKIFKQILGLFYKSFVYFLTENPGWGWIEAKKCLGVWKVKKPPSFYRENRKMERMLNND